MLKGDDFSNYLRASYQNGMDFLVTFNDLSLNWSVDDQIKQADSLEDLPLPETKEYMRQVFDLDYTRDYRGDLIPTPRSGVEYKGIRLISTDQNSWIQNRVFAERLLSEIFETTKKSPCKAS